MRVLTTLEDGTAVDVVTTLVKVHIRPETSVPEDGQCSLSPTRLIWELPILVHPRTAIQPRPACRCTCIRVGARFSEVAHTTFITAIGWCTRVRIVSAEPEQFRFWNTCVIKKFLDRVLFSLRCNAGQLAIARRKSSIVCEQCGRHFGIGIRRLRGAIQIELTCENAGTRTRERGRTGSSCRLRRSRRDDCRQDDKGGHEDGSTFPRGHLVLLQSRHVREVIPKERECQKHRDGMTALGNPLATHHLDSCTKDGLTRNTSVCSVTKRLDLCKTGRTDRAEALFDRLREMGRQ